MVAQDLSNDDVTLGRLVLLATDALQMGAEGAFWLRDDREDVWRFFLVTSLFGQIETRKMFESLRNGLSRTLSKAEIRGFDYFLVPPSDPIVMAVAKEIETNPRSSEPFKVAVQFKEEATEALVYRMARNQAAASKLSRTRFQRSVRQLAHA